MVSGVEKGGDGVTGTEIQNLSRVKHNKAYGGKYRNTGLVIQFMFIYSICHYKICPSALNGKQEPGLQHIGFRCYKKISRPFESVDHSHKLVTVQQFGLFGDF